jgi:hypothetical protein
MRHGHAPTVYNYTQPLVDWTTGFYNIGTYIRNNIL